MFGWSFQKIHLVNRLWIAFLLVFLVAILIRPDWLRYLQSPLENGWVLLWLVGRILIVDCALSVGLLLIAELGQAVGRRIDQRNEEKFFTNIEFQPSINGCLLPFANSVLFLAAVIFAPDLPLPWWVAAFGWLLYLEVEIAHTIDTDDIKVCDYAEIEMSEDSDMAFISVQSGKKVLASSMRTDWLKKERR